MKKNLLLSLLLLLPVLCFAVPYWVLKSPEGATLHLAQTCWASSVDGEKVYFDGEQNGHFENMMRFSYIPDFTDLGEGHIRFKEVSPFCGLYRGQSKTPFNIMRLGLKNGRNVLVDKRGVRYVQVDYAPTGDPRGKW